MVIDVAPSQACVGRVHDRAHVATDTHGPHMRICSAWSSRWRWHAGLCRFQGCQSKAVVLTACCGSPVSRARRSVTVSAMRTARGCAHRSGSATSMPELLACVATQAMPHCVASGCPGAVSSCAVSRPTSEAAALQGAGRRQDRLPHRWTRSTSSGPGTQRKGVGHGGVASSERDHQGPGGGRCRLRRRGAGRWGRRRRACPTTARGSKWSTVPRRRGAAGAAAGPAGSPPDRAARPHACRHPHHPGTTTTPTRGRPTRSPNRCSTSASTASSGPTSIR